MITLCIPDGRGRKYLKLKVITCGSSPLTVIKVLQKADMLQMKLITFSIKVLLRMLSETIY